MTGFLADTSVFVAAEQRRSLGSAPGDVSQISVVTLTELEFGVLRASSPELRALREATLDRARSFIALPYDEAVSSRLAKLLAAARDAGRRAGAMDTIIAATALTHDLTIWSQDDDFEVLVELVPELRVKRG